MAYQVRRATQEDAAAISRIVVAALRDSDSLDFLPQVIAELEISFNPKVREAMFSQRAVFVATLDGVVVGTASLEKEWVRSVFVEPRYQTLGLGRMLMKVVHASIWKGGWRLLFVRSSIEAVKFFEGMGYKVVRYEFRGSERNIVMEVEL